MRNLAALLVLAVAALLTAGPGAAQSPPSPPSPSPSAQPTPARGPRFRGEPDAVRDVTNALQRLNRLNAYRVRYSERGVQGSFVIDIQNPDRRRALVPQEGATLEITQVGPRTVVRLTRPDMNGQWRCSPVLSASADMPITNPSLVDTEVEVVRQRDDQIQLSRVQTFDFTMRLPDGSVLRSRLYVNQAGGQPRRWMITDGDGEALGTVDYYDYNAAITIQLPACE